MRRVIFVDATDQFELILIFDNNEYRKINIKEFLINDQDFNGVRNDLQIFQTAEVDILTGAVKWLNGINVDSGLLYMESKLLKTL